MSQFSKGFTKVFFALILFQLVLPSTAYAYIDPGSGSMIIQFVIAALLGTLFAIKTFWNRIKNMVKKSFSGRRGDAND